MKERPILFSAPMVRAILDGRKTMTRRVIKPQPDCKQFNYNKVNQVGEWFHIEADEPRPVMHTVKCPYGIPGDELWVRETWGIIRHRRPEIKQSLPLFEYEEPIGETQDEQFHNAMNGNMRIEEGCEIVYRADNDIAGTHWRPSIHMPRWVSRIQLRTTSVRAERLQDISEADARREGVERPPLYSLTPDYRAWFEHLWNKINGKKHPWESNPWVWAVEFERIAK